MKFSARIWLSRLLLIIVAFALSSPLQAQKSLSGKQDIPELMALAEKNFDLSKQDAVILFEGKKLCWLEDGRLIDYVHRIIWINTNHAVETYGDHRIPYDSKNCEFHVETIRTWRDGQWWETGETGIVETTPYELEKAYDYTNIREMMLLHDGIELPCILEVAYYIEDKEPFREGIDGIWTFAKNEPVIWSWFGYGVPAGTKPNVGAAESLSEPEMETDERYNLDVYWWKTELLDKTPVDHTQDPTLDSPYLIYTTWYNLTDLGYHISKRIYDAAIFPEGLEADLDSILQDALIGIDSVNAITEYVGSKVRLVEYDNLFWKYSPRPAARTYKTAYAHRFDRTVLVMVLLKKADFGVTPYYVSNYYEDIPRITFGPPTTSVMRMLSLNVYKESTSGLYDPYTNSLSPGLYYFNHRIEWTPGREDWLIYHQSDYPSTRNEIKLILEYDKKNNKIAADGIIYSNNYDHLYSNIYGTGNKAKTYLNKVISSLISELKITDYNPILTAGWEDMFSFKCEIDKIEPDDNGRTTLTLGRPTGGLSDQLPDFIRLTDQTIEQNVLLKTPVTEIISITLKLDDIDLVYKPENKSIANNCGKFDLLVAENNNRLSIIRQVKLTRSKYTPDDWDLLRQLLLAHSNERYNTLIFKTDTEEAEKEE